MRFQVSARAVRQFASPVSRSGGAVLGASVIATLLIYALVVKQPANSDLD
jgi:hypothetical protein